MAMAAASSITNEARDEIKAVMRKGLEGSLSSFLPNLVQVLKQHQLAWSQRISSLLVGVHPSNRDGQGISSSTCSVFAVNWLGGAGSCKSHSVRKSRLVIPALSALTSVS